MAVSEPVHPSATAPGAPTASAADPAAQPGRPPAPSLDPVGVGPTTQELRIATAMTGGVSLAIWMGGVARELNLLHQASRQRVAGVGDSHPHASGTGPRRPNDTSAGPAHVAHEEAATPDDRVRALYRRLLVLMDATVSIDVLSGTSAGGINAAVLGMAHAGGLDVAPLRELWLTAGAFDTLLRDPVRPDRPASLLQGDGVLLTKLGDGLRTLAETRFTVPGTGAAAQPPETTVFVTTTFLTGETSRFTDTYGTLVPDVDHHGLFTFHTDDLRSRDCLPAIALAARSSASFPAAFEPSFLPFGQAVDATHPDMARYLPITRSHYVADGGLLANRPIGPLLQAVFDRPLHESREVRRVLLYVVPSPGDPDPRNQPPVESITDPPTLPAALVADLGAVLSQSIAADLGAIRRHNDRVDAMRDARLRIAELGLVLRTADPAARVIGPGLLADFREREGESVARRVVDTLMREVSSLPTADIPARWQAGLRPGTEVEADCRQAVVDAVAARWGAAPTTGDVAGAAAFGPAAFEAGRITAFTLLRLGFDLATTAKARAALAGFTNALFDVSPAPHADLAGATETAVNKARAPGATSSLPDVAVTIAGSVVGPAVGPATAPTAEPAAGPATGSAGAASGQPGSTISAVEDAWWALAGTLWSAGPTLWALVPRTAIVAGPAAPPGATTESRRSAAAGQLLTYLRYLGLPEPNPAAAAPAPERGAPGAPSSAPTPSAAGPARSSAVAIMVTRLLDLHVTERALLPVEASIDQAVELVQVSADTRTLLAPRLDSAGRKLTGMQLHHFGAFYKSSWRANDWMWGRLDGAGWLVHLLLEPRRVLTLAEAAQVPPAERPAWFLNRLGGAIGAEPGADSAELTDHDGAPVVLDRAAMTAELRYLTDPTIRVPASLPLTAIWAAATLQSWITAAELPVVAREMLVNPRRSAGGWPQEVLVSADRTSAVVEAARVAVATSSDRRSRRLATALITDQQGAATTQAQTAAATAGTLPGAPAPPSAAPVTDPARARRLARLLASCPVPAETLREEVGSPLFTRTVTKATAVATAALTGGDNPPAALRPVLSSARTVTLTGYRAAGITGGTARRLLIAGLGLMVVGTFAATQHLVLLGLAGVLVALTGAYLAVLAVWGFGRGAVRAGVATLVLVVLVLPWLPFARDFVFGSPDCASGDTSCQGYVATSVVPWLRDQRFPWLVPVLLLLGAGLLGAVVGRGTVKRRSP